MKTRIILFVLLGLGLLGGVLVRQSYRCPAAAPTAESQEEEQKLAELLGETPPSAALSLEAKLLQPVSLSFDARTLRQALSDLGKFGKLNLVFDEPALRDANVDLERRCSLHVDAISFRSALNLLLQKTGADLVTRDEVLQITSEVAARGKMRQVTYQVADLVVPVNFQADCCDRAARKEARDDSLPDILINTILRSIHPETWQATSGAGTIQYFPLGMALVINQTEKAHEQIAKLLSDLRRMQEIEIAHEVRIFKLPKEAIERWGLDGAKDDDPYANDRGRLAVVSLSESKRRAFLEAVQADPRTSVMQAPKLTTFNGQRACISAMEQQTHVVGYEINASVLKPQNKFYEFGHRLAFCSTLDFDRKSIRVHLKTRMDTVDLAAEPKLLVRVQFPSDKEPKTYSTHMPRVHSLEVERTFQVADGGTALLYAGVMKGQLRSPFCPFLSDVPGLAWLQELLGDVVEDAHVVILVSPRIVPPQSEQPVFLGQRTSAEPAPAPGGQGMGFGATR